MKNIAFIFIFFLNYQSAGAQEREVTGRLVDSETLKPIGLASVIVPGTYLEAVTNAGGYFRLKVQLVHENIIVSRIGYKTSVVPIPEIDKFQVRIEKEVIRLVELNLISCEKNDQPSSKLTADDALYTGGWSKFYSEVFSILSGQEVLTSVVQDSSLHIHFTVESNGNIVFTKTEPEVPKLNELLNASAGRLSKWKSATQNGFPVAQFFELPVGKNIGIDEGTDLETATPIGGLPGFYRFVGENMRYPADARRHGIQGKVFVQFIIEKEGSITNPIIIQGIGGGCDEEVLRVMSKSPKWNPGKQKGKPVRQRYTLPMIFKLG